MSGLHPSSGGWTAAAATPLRTWRDADLARMAGVLADAWRAWALEWEVPAQEAAALACRCADRSGVDLDGWCLLGTRAQARGWLRWSGAEATQLAASWFDSDDADTPVLRDLVQSALDDLAGGLARALQLTRSAPSGAPAAHCFTRWSGAVVASLPWGGLLLAEPGLVQPPVTRSPLVTASALVGVGAAIAGQALRLRVDLDGCELPMAALQCLRAGDVLRLPHRVDAPATVLDASGQAMFRGWLARSRGRRAVELAALSEMP